MTSLSAGSHTVRAVIRLTSGGSETLTATFNVSTSAPAYALLCSPDSTVDGHDNACQDGSFSAVTRPSGIWTHLSRQDTAATDYARFSLNDSASFIWRTGV